jgi:hypothetical protein
VTFNHNRIYNQHNIDSAMFLPKDIGKSYAFDYLVENPVNIFPLSTLADYRNSDDAMLLMSSDQHWLI